MRRGLCFMLALVAAALVSVGCAKPTSATTTCKGQDGSITVCVNGNKIAFDAASQPHGHEPGDLYVPVDLLAKQLHLDVHSTVSSDGKQISVTLNGKPFAPAMADGAKGVHVHNGLVYVPLREFTAAAGLKLALDTDHGTAGIAQ